MEENNRHYKKRELLHTVSMLEKANDAVGKAMKTDRDGAADALVSCQESAILIGTYLESLGEAYADLVKLLEDYCENIYLMCQALPEETQCRKIAKKIQKQLSQIRHGITYDLPDDRKEIVFLPYKASMWDSLESVWRAADADPDCDAYVIPISYFEKNPDGSLGEEHYEGGLYPKDVPVTHYNDYDFETRRPDVIYFHNPYDEYNHVTSVHPYFYSKNLRNFTEKLVYIPYFILKEINPDDQVGIENMKHFCFLPGTVYADKVILQSENMRRIYINEYMKAAGQPDDRKLRQELEKRFLGLGSPKFDKIQSVNIENIPEKWKSKLYKKDGTKKRIIFFNTNVSLILHNADKFIDNLKRIFIEIEKYSDEYSVIWREHPLSMATITSMKPQLINDYKRIIEEMCLKEWVIIDDSVEAYTAIGISDCYFGAGGSLITLYSVLGKPMMITDYHYPNKISDKEISIEKLIRSMGPRAYMNERNKNSLSLFLEKMSDLEKMQLRRLEEEKNRPIKNAGRKISDCIINEC